MRVDRKYEVRKTCQSEKESSSGYEEKGAYLVAEEQMKLYKVEGGRVDWMEC